MHPWDVYDMKRSEKINDTAQKLADHVLNQKNPKGDLRDLLTHAIEAIFGNKEQFLKNFLSQLTPEELEAFYALLNKKMRQLQGKSIDNTLLEKIKKILQKAGASNIQEASINNIAPSSSAGKSPYRPRKGR